MRLKEIFINMGRQRRQWTGQLNMVEKGILNQIMLYSGNGRVMQTFNVWSFYLSKVVAVNVTPMEMVNINNQNVTILLILGVLYSVCWVFFSCASKTKPNKERMLLEFYVTNWNREQRTHRELCDQILAQLFHPGLFPLPTGLPHLTYFSSHNKLKHVKINSIGC